jgi:hypothetical protein
MVGEDICMLNNKEPLKIIGYKVAFDTWLKNSSIGGDKTAIESRKSTTPHIEIGYEILMNVKVSSTTMRTYAEVSYEKGPIFFFFDCYKTATGWSIPILRFHSEVDRILPDAIINRK